MKISILTLVATTLFLTAAEARQFELPLNCEYGRAKSYDIHAGEDLSNAIEAGYDIYQDPSFSPTNYSAWLSLINGIRQLIDGFDYLRIETPDHVLQGREFRVKANLFDRLANVQFNNSEYGYVGTDKSNWDANAYLNMTFSRTYGTGLVWVNRASGMCSAEPVWVQKPPRVKSGTVRLSDGKILTNLDYSIDKYSRAFKDSNTPVRVTITAVNSSGNAEVKTQLIHSSGLSGQSSVLFSPQTGGGTYTVYGTVNDGTYAHRITLGSVNVPGPSYPPCLDPEERRCPVN